MTDSAIHTEHAAPGSVVLRLTNVGFSYTMRGSRRSGASRMDVGESATGVLGGAMRRVGRRTIVVNALDGVSLEVHAGERLGVLGASCNGSSSWLAPSARCRGRPD